MALGADDCQTSGLLDLGGQFDVGTAAGHIRGDCNRGRLTGQSYDFSLALMVFGVEHIVGDVAHLQHAAQQLAYLDRGSADEHGASFRNKTLDLFDDSGIFFFLSLVDTVVHVDTRNRPVRRNCHDIELVDIPELAGLGLGRTGHTGQLVIHSEIVLERDSGEGLGRSLDLHSLLGLDSLMETVAVAASFHYTARLFVDDFDLAVVDDIFDVLVEEGVGFEKLVDGMDTLGLHAVVLHIAVFGGLTLGEILNMLGLGELGGDVGKHEELGIGRTGGHLVDTLVGKIDAAVLLVDDEIKRLGCLRHLARVVLKVICLGFEQYVLHALETEELDEGAVFRQTFICAEQSESAFFGYSLVVAVDLCLGLGQELSDESALSLEHSLYIGAELIEHLIVALGHRA